MLAPDHCPSLNQVLEILLVLEPPDCHHPLLAMGIALIVNAFVFISESDGIVDLAKLPGNVRPLRHICLGESDKTVEAF